MLLQLIKHKKAGLSRATIDIYSGISYKFFPCDMRDCLLFEVFIWSICKLWFGHWSLSLKFEQDQVNGCWYIHLLIFWVHLMLEVVFTRSICKLWCSHLSQFVKFKVWAWSDQWLLRYSNFNILRSFSLGGSLYL